VVNPWQSSTQNKAYSPFYRRFDATTNGSFILKGKTMATRTTNNTQQELERPAALTVNARGVAVMLGVSVRQVWRLHTTGRLPRAIRLGNCVRWRKAELEAFVEAGCPTREKWEGSQRSGG
jgi:predicted DNA-binding transcriptional regulator AlpA